MEKKVGGRIGTFVADEVSSIDIWDSAYETLEKKAKTGSVVWVGTGGDSRKVGPGLFEFLDKGNQIPFSPGEFKEMKDYELTPEEHAKFDALPGLTKEEIETAKKVLAKTLRKEVSSLDTITDFLENTWYNKGQPKREVTFQTGPEGERMLAEMISKQFQEQAQIDNETYLKDTMMSSHMRQRRS